MNEQNTPPTAPTNSTEESTAGVVLDMLRAEDATTPQENTSPVDATVYELQSPSLTTADKWYAGVSGFIIGVCIALAAITAVYMLYTLAFPEGSAHDLIDTE